MLSNHKNILGNPAVYLTSLLLGLTSCGNISSVTTNNLGNSSNQQESVFISGAGASFPAPLYQRWITEYTSNTKNANLQIKYDSVGSGAGVKNFLTQTVDFGASDAPLNPEEIKQFPPGRGTPLQIPMTGGSVVFAYNLSNFEGLEQIKLSRESYCGIVSGEINTWNDPSIAADNPNIRLPNLPIIFIHRSDGSGTTFIFTNHLQAACPEWEGGAGKSIEWPTGIGADGNQGVSAQIQQSQGAIGYTEYSYAKDNNLSMAILKNKAGRFIQPSPDAASQAFAQVNVPDNFALIIPDPNNPNAYPIVGLTWLLIYGNYDDQNKIEALKQFITWSLNEGDIYTKNLGYVPIPDELQERVLLRLEQSVN